jgi:aryl-alcohol dehydrogenase-like predicted oxidoreductase
VEKGVGWIDTADSYGRGEDQGELGYAENIIGEVSERWGGGGGRERERDILTRNLSAF